jgi:hypothetical protein
MRSSVQRRRIRSIASARRSRRSFAPGHSAPVAGVSLIDSPVPTPIQIRPGFRHASVPNAWAITDGW